MDDKLLDIQELCSWLGVSQSTIYHWTAAREIPFVKVGRLMRFSKPDIESWLRDRKVEVV